MNQDTIDDIIFESRNKQYGAYDLRRSYARNLLRGFLFTVLLVVAGYLYFIIHVNFIDVDDYTFSSDYTQYIKYDVDEELMKLAQFKPEEPVEAEVRVERSLQPRVVVAVVPQVDSVASDKILPLPTDTTAPAGDGGEDDYTSVDSITGDLIVRVDSLPRFNGDVNGFRTYLVSKIKYPDTSLLRLMDGQLTLSMVIQANGLVGKITLDKVQSSPWAQELIRVIRNAPLWQPAMARGKPVSILFSLPLYFMK